MLLESRFEHLPLVELHAGVVLAVGGEQRRADVLHVVHGVGGADDRDVLHGIEVADRHALAKNPRACESARHAAALDVVDLLVRVLARAVEFRRVNMHDEWLARDFRDGETRGVGEPIVCVDHIEIHAPRCVDGEAHVALSHAEEVAGVVR